MARRGCVDEAATISGCQDAGCQGCHWDCYPGYVLVDTGEEWDDEVPQRV